jgi:L-asparaginase
VTSTRKVSLATLGGTVTMTPVEPGAGVVPTVGADDLLSSVPGLDDLADLRAETLFKKPGASLTIEDVLAVLAWAEAQVSRGVDGVVIVQGTDTLEEVAYLLDLLWTHEEPLVLTGAMRAPHQLSADGAANLTAAVIVAASPSCHGLGVTVAIDDEIHAARRVAKRDTCALAAFSSGPFGPLGRLHEGRISLANQVVKAPAVAPPARTDPLVVLLESTLGDCAGAAELVLGSPAVSGVVLAGFGAGHVAADIADLVARSAVPVVAASRTGSGPVFEATYGFPGSERDLIAKGAIPSGWLQARKARLLLMLLLGNDLPDAHIRTMFAAHGALP